MTQAEREDHILKELNVIYEAQATLIRLKHAVEEAEAKFDQLRYAFAREIAHAFVEEE